MEEDIVVTVTIYTTYVRVKLHKHLNHHLKISLYVFLP